MKNQIKTKDDFLKLFNKLFPDQIAEDYNERIKKPQITWNNTYYAVGIEGNVISDEMLRILLTTSS